MNRRGRILAVLVAIASLLMMHVPAARAETEGSLIREGEIDALFQAYCADNALDPELISIAYVYTADDETWYHGENRWYYSASLYKVPLMMLLAEKEHDGELTEDSMINGMTLRDIRKAVLVESNNPIAYSTLLYFGQPDTTRRMFCRYSELPEDYYTWDFYGGSWFTARFMSDVMRTLFREPDRFPYVTDDLKRAQPDHYFRLKLGENDSVAQKYGTYEEEDGTNWNHTAGIIYTPNPFLLTVMTKYGGISENIIGDLAVLFHDYTLILDERLKLTCKDVNPPEALDKTPDPEEGGNDREAGRADSARQASLPERVEEQRPASGSEEGEAVRGAAAGLRTQKDVRLLLITAFFCAEVVLIAVLLLRNDKRKTSVPHARHRKR